MVKGSRSKPPRPRRGRPPVEPARIDLTQAATSPANALYFSLERLGQVQAKLDELEAQVVVDVAAARDAGASWRQVGNALDISPQGAQQRFGTTRPRHSS